ncbi:hypothetical protein EJ03DRAFT_276811 [Teratosphaeria nubilosa]|uniref:Uncharacterized protein n=1 Tax=Teratosphaeria nubilosa TaxID=161662 RepID=A0A6G1L2G9_9PEZI|nr:hypothetical protein EJ03DRAFT_276811 [Teratosphaeria nubilosa]
MEAAVRWSPHSTGDSRRFLVLDVADSSLTLNEVDTLERHGIEYHQVARRTKLPNYTAFAWSPIQEPVVALGLTSGNASLISLSSDRKSSEAIATFKIKQQRKCNSIALSSENWLAVALDRARSDVCLNVFDTNADSASSQEPVRRLCAAEVVSSVRFFSNQPQELVVSTQRAFIRLYDLRDGYPAGGGNAQAATRNVSNIAIDPLDENYFASAGGASDPSVAVWDKRWITQPTTASSNSNAVFNFSPAIEGSGNASIWTLRYSGLQRGRLAVYSSAGELRVIDMLEGPTADVQTSEYLPSNPFGGAAWRTNRCVSQSRTVLSARRSEEDNDSINGEFVAFDWTNDQTAHSGQAAMMLTAERGVKLLRVPTSSPHVEITARQDLSVGFEELSIVEQKPYATRRKRSAPYEHPDSQDAAEDFGPRTYDPEASFVIEPESASRHCGLDSPHIGKMLASGTVQRERCKRGYLWDCHKNMETVAGDWQLERLWEIVHRFRELAANDGMMCTVLDLSYIGVFGFWNESIGNESRRRLSPFPMRFADAVSGLNAQRKIPAFDGERTSFPEHRQLCLAVCGWQFTVETLEAECQELIDRGLHYQAIVQAVLHGYKHIALNLLRTLIRSRTIPNIGLGALLASDHINEEQREMCMWMAADTEDPALKALLTFLTTGDWRDVMKTNYLHLGYRLALGLKYLNDTELSGFIETETARAIRNGDLEGILLTGLTEQAMNLFQTYITKTNDLQTAVLATAYTNPLYVDDVRWEMWKETYCMQMQSWRALPERAKFNVNHSRLARSKDGRTLVEPPPKQIKLRCSHCQGSLDSHGSNTTTSKPTGMAANTGTVCQTCGRHMPRCSICLHWLGTPTAARKSEEGSERPDDIMAAFLSFCASCSHAFHADHARTWFEKHDMCPVPGCRCTCVVR